MKAVRVEWNRGDTFDTMHKKLLALLGQKIVNKGAPSKSFKVFEVGNIHESVLSSLGAGYFLFLEGDKQYTNSDGSYNFQGSQYTPVWRFIVKFGFEEPNDIVISWEYSFTVPRYNSYEEDKSQIVIDSDHPFVHYADDLWKK